MMPAVEHAGFDRLAIPPARRMRLIARRWCSWPASADVASFEVDAQAGAEQRLARYRAWPGRCRRRAVDVALANQPADMLAAAGVDDRRPADQQRLAAFRLGSIQLVGRSREWRPPWAFRSRRCSTMNPKRGRPRPALAAAGKTRTPGMADDDTVSPDARRSSARSARRPAAVDDDAAVHFLVLDVDPWPSRRISVRWLVVL